MVKTLHFHCRVHGFDPWVRELRFRKPRGAAKRKKKKNQDELGEDDSLRSTELYLECTKHPFAQC